MYFLVNASPPKPLDVKTSYIADVLDQKWVFAMVYHRLKSSYHIIIIRTLIFRDNRKSAYVISSIRPTGRLPAMMITRYHVF